MKENIEKYADILEKSSLFRGFDHASAEKALILFGAEFESFKKGQLLHPPYNTFDRFGLVLSGHINVCSDDINGNRTIMASVGPAVTFGESLAFLSLPEPSVYAYADEDSEVLWLKPDGLYITDSAEPEFALGLQRRFTAMIAERALNLNSRIQILSKLTLREKIIALLTSSMTDSKTDEITLPFGRENMASFLGTNRSALSRELSRMKKDGILDFHKNNFKIQK